MARLRRWWTRLVSWINAREIDEGAPLMIVGAVTGLIAGLGIVVFYLMIDASFAILSAWPERHIAWAGQAILRVLFTSVGVWLAWLIVRRAHAGEGQNVPDIQLAVAKRAGVVRIRPVAARTLASAVTLGSGGSVGSEGPVAVLGASVGSALGRALGFRPRHLKILVGCGAAAGIAGAFNAPFAGAFFALEEILGSFSIGAFSPVVIASVVGALTVRSFLGTHPAFHMPAAIDVHPVANAFLYPVLGVACGLASALYSRLDTLAPRVMRRIGGPEWARPVIGGAIVGAIVVSSRGILAGNGHLAIPREIFGGLAWYALIALSLAKILATVITLGSGGSGGVFTPALFIGASLGGGVGSLVARIFPGHVVQPASWALVGMAGLVSGATRAPLTAIFIVFELTNDSGYVVPLMIVSVVAFVTAKRFAPYGLYDGWLAARGEHLAHGVDQSVMEQILVRDAVDSGAPRARPDTSVEALACIMNDARAGAVAIVDADDALVGIVWHQELHQALMQPIGAQAVVIAEDLAEAVESARPEQSLRDALATMNARRRDALPVVDAPPNRRPRFVGMISRSAAFAAYDRALEHAV
ncbi:MAG TPA: chloride channel protein [Gemmatimonadaceae bacterium]|nr:chloride channel protein [Gemmatimonadaceae bacterium]